MKKTPTLRSMLLLGLNPQSFTALFTICALLLSSISANAEWRFAHADPGNTSFARVNTSVARLPKLAATGPVAFGANPVIGPDGTVYVGNLDGELRAFYPDGTASWTRKVGSLHGGIAASPVVSADGSVFVVSSVRIRDAQGSRSESFLHKFTPGGGWLFTVPFPKSTMLPFTDGGITNAAPNIWTWAGYEAIIIPVIYTGERGENISLVAFSTYGAVLGQTAVTTESYGDVTGDVPATWGNVGLCLIAGAATLELGCLIAAYMSGWMCCSFEAPEGVPVPASFAGFPLPSVAIYQDPRGGTPRVLATDGKHDRVLYAFAMQYGFTELTRVSDRKRPYTTPPVALPDGTGLLGTADGVLTQFGPSLAEISVPSGLGMATAPATRLKDGMLIVVSREGKVSRPGYVSWQPGGESIASAAASCTHFFVSTTEGLFTYDTNNLVQKAVVPWTNGGISAPAIGTNGQVYAIANDNLYTFPAPLNGGVVGTTACDTGTPTKK